MASVKKAYIYIILIACGILLLAGGGVLVWEKKQGVTQPQPGTQTIEQPANTDEMESVKDLIDGEYAFTPIDTSDWQTYRNEELGFEVKIPKGWKLVDTYKDENIKGSYLYFGQENTTYSIPEGGGSNAAILVLASDRNNKKAMPLRDFLQKRASGYGEKVSSLLVDQIEAVMLGETSVHFFEGNKTWVISFQLYYDRDNNIHINEHDIFLGIIMTFKFLK